MQLRRRCEHSVHSTTEILFRPLKSLRRHARLGLNAVNAVINRGVETTELEIKARVRAERPQQWHAQIKAQIRPKQGQVEAPTVQPTRNTLGASRQHKRRQNPDACLHLTKRAKTPAQPTQNPTPIRRAGTGATHTQGIDIEHPMTGFGQRHRQVLFVGPQRMIPVRCGQKDHISHQRQLSSSIAISRKLDDIALNVLKSPEAWMPPSAIS